MGDHYSYGKKRCFANFKLINFAHEISLGKY